ncbi:BamA/TamA family outer membrane protein [Hymenobacter terricola]|uniref:hypothetical protein n=1 Tax=Hymenobacter terricola TaxID=2819236 RepID=UPI001B301577|nr:hypothetical protein [Hymenobacter terricola]
MLSRVLFFGWLLSVGLLLAGRAMAQSAPVYSVFLVGGTGVGNEATLTATLALLRTQSAAAGPLSTLVLLGDNLSNGLPAASKASRAAAQNRLVQVLELLKTYPGRLVVVPGGEDWQRGGRQGWQRVQEQEKFVESYLKRGDVFVPSNGCPGPVEIALDPQHTLVVLDTQWWLHAWDKPGEESACDAKDPAAVVVQLQDVLNRNEGRHLLVVGHHALAGAGNSLWQEAMPNPRQRIMRRSLLGVLNKYPGITYASGHERRLEYDEEAGLHYLISGAAATPAGAAAFPKVPYAARTPGFARLDYAANGEVRASFWSTASGQPVYEKQWVEPCVVQARARDTARLRTAPQLVRVRASTRYGAGRLKQWLQGTNYRREWQQPVQVPVLDLGRAYGGLTPVKRGGGFQTKSLRLRGADGQEYVLRSVDKSTDSSVPYFLRKTFAADLVQDQISAAHPYAALVVPVLAEAAGVGHTTPRLVQVPDDPRLGPYRREFAGSLALLEAREPAPPRSFTGRPDRKKYSTPDVLAALEADPRNRVDQRAVLRARLLDMVLADWDRHDDQWRWLAYPRPGGGWLFRAVPRDRDQAFFVNQGFLPRQASKEYLLPRIQGFDTNFRNVDSFNFQARYFDRSFLTELSRADWQAVADSVQASLSDAVLESALRQWPDSIYQLSGPTVLAKLQAHRAHLPAWAAEYYQFLAQAVDVLGTKEREYVDVVRQEDNRTQVTVYEQAAGAGRGAPLYQRTFLPAETKEIRLYGLGGADVFTLEGRSQHGPLVRIIGGAGADSVIDRSRVAAGSRKTRVYDERDGIAVTKGPETATHLRTQPDINLYNRTAFQYPYLAPLYPWSFNADDGLFVGLGGQLKRPGFRKEPWAVTHTLTGRVALRTGAFDFHYDGLFTHLIGSLDLHLEATAQAPNYVRNFFGLGNDSPFNSALDLSYYRVRFRNLTGAVLLQRAVGTRLHVFGGPMYQRVEVENVQGRILAQVSDERLHPETLFSTKQYAGGRLGFSVISPDAKAAFPQGVAWQTELTALGPLTATARPFTYLSSDLALYRSFRFPVRLTLAARFGGAANFGDYEFFQAATLGGLSNLRGYRRTRFAGRSCAYNNLEARLELGRFTSYVLPATFGVLGFHDIGRVWVPGETSDTWHRGYGGGIWLAPTPQVVLAAMYGFSKEDQLPLIRLGYFF